MPMRLKYKEFINIIMFECFYEFLECFTVFGSKNSADIRQPFPEILLREIHFT